MIPEAALVSFVAALFSIMNPIGNLGIFAGLTADRPVGQVRGAAWTCAFATIVALLIVAWTGSLLLDFFGITVDTLRAAGGLIILLIGLHMLGNNHVHITSQREKDDAHTRTSIGVVPMAIPIVAGPGTMATVLVAAQQDPSLLEKGEISVVIIVLAMLTGLLFSFSASIAKFLGECGLGVVTRVMGMILAAIAMGMIGAGLKGMFPGLAG